MTLPKEVAQAIAEHIVDDELAEVIILKPGEELHELYPEYIDPLPKGYTIQLVILSDWGNGVYYVTPPEEVQ